MLAVFVMTEDRKAADSLGLPFSSKKPGFVGFLLAQVLYRKGYQNQHSCDEHRCPD